MTFDAPVLVIASTSASRLGSTLHAITYLSSLSHLKSSSSSASSLNSCARELTEAGIMFATNLLTSLGEGGAFPPSVFLASQ